MRGRMCPCGTFPAGDPSDAHSAQHTAWLGRAELDAARGDDPSGFAAALARVEQERDDLAARAADLEQVREELRQQRLLVDGYHADYAEWAGEKQELVDRSLALKAELASARTELEQLRYSGWIVARDGGRGCDSCEQEIRRGEAYQVDVSGDVLSHVRCPGAASPTYWPESTVRTRDADGNDHHWLIDETGRPTPVTEGPPT